MNGTITETADEVFVRLDDQDWWIEVERGVYHDGRIWTRDWMVFSDGRRVPMRAKQ